VARVADRLADLLRTTAGVGGRLAIEEGRMRLDQILAVKAGGR
jgi:hypothetical protein